MKKLPLWKQLGLPCPLRVKVNGKRTSPHRIYRIWAEMKRRVRKTPGFRRNHPNSCYLALDLTLAPEWEKFENFYRWAMAHGYRDDLTIDRIDGSKGYAPENCRWATWEEQNRNRHMTAAWRAHCRRIAALGWKAAAAARRAKARAKRLARLSPQPPAPRRPLFFATM
ncbi:MAG: hypothetical protein IJ829_07725 [Kiritimatiellae bacterium]|nr:hypothetical protein [Kiritimatiellia bacterium]